MVRLTLAAAVASFALMAGAQAQNADTAEIYKNCRVDNIVDGLFKSFSSSCNLAIGDYLSQFGEDEVAGAFDELLDLREQLIDEGSSTRRFDTALVRTGSQFGELPGAVSLAASPN